MLIRDIDITKLSSFKINAYAKFVALCSTQNDLCELSTLIRQRRLSHTVVGHGTNTIFGGNYNGVVIRYINSFISQEGPNTIRVSSGVLLDDLIIWIIQNNLHGMASLSGIPGTVGGAICLNAGAFGATISEYLKTVEVFDLNQGKYLYIPRKDLSYSHRRSIFTKTSSSNWIITSAELELPKKTVTPIHPRLEISPNTPASIIRREVLAQRSKMPDHMATNYCGSFFLNPIVNDTYHKKILRVYPEVKSRPKGRKYEISAGSLLEMMGFRDRCVGPFYFHHENANYVINQGNATGDDLVKLLNSIYDLSIKKIGIPLLPEPKIL